MPKPPQARDERAIRDDLAAAQAEYHDGADVLAAPRLRGLADRVKALRDELSAALAAGAAPCPGCGTPPLAMLKRPETDREGPRYEVGCPACPPADGRRPAAQGHTAARAVEKWNAGEYLPAPDATAADA